jgi:hypothetical protein
MTQHRSSRNSQTLARQASELAFAVPQVMAHRLTRMALAGGKPNARDRREFHGMGQEKVLAFWQSWFAMSAATVEATQKAWLAMAMGAQVPMVDAQAIFAKGLAPVHRKATANARRLGRTRLV